MTDKEKLIAEIMAEAEKDGEPVTREEAEEMAEMEIGAKEIKNYAQATPTAEKKERKPRERKVDPDKKFILDLVENPLLKGLQAEEVVRKTETEVEFTYKGERYSIRLVKHRPKK